MATELNLPRMKIWRVLKTNNYKPYRIHVSQFLRPGDNVRRLEYCNWLIEKINENNDFLNNVVWTDECNFSSCGMFNRNNEHYWATDNPRQNRQIRNQGRFSINVWIGMWNNQLIGPYTCMMGI